MSPTNRFYMCTACLACPTTVHVPGGDIHVQRWGDVVPSVCDLVHIQIGACVTFHLHRLGTAGLELKGLGHN